VLKENITNSINARNNWRVPKINNISGILVLIVAKTPKIPEST
jgi:hypothetical protein